MSTVPKSSNSDELTPLQQPHREDRNYRNLVAYWILGLCNNFGYVVMLSAAHDILSENFSQNGEGKSSEPVADNSTRECNPTSTGAILLADILPSLAIKLLAPFLLFLVHVRMLVVVLLAAVGFLLVAFSTSEWIAILGVACTSLGAGLGEVTLLSYSSVFDKNVISTWSSGTGAAGILGAGSYAGLTALGLSAVNSLLLMLVVPVLMAASFWLLLRAPASGRCPWESVLNGSTTDQAVEDHSPSSETIIQSETVSVESPPTLTIQEKFRIIPSLLVYMVPLGLVYLFEYFINQGLFELTYFPNIWLDHHEQYRWYQVVYQIGVFLSRSSVNLLVIHKLWLLAIFQFLNVIFFTFEAVYLFVPSIWIIFAAVLWEGLLGGAAYVNTFYRMSIEVPFEKRGSIIGKIGRAHV